MQRRTLGRSAGGAMRARAGFTLVELLVVSIIIAILAALAVPAVMRAATAAQNARIKTEIDMLHQAIMQYKNEYGSFPPCVNIVAGGQSNVIKHLRRIFPRILDGNLPGADQMPNPGTALFGWLTGYAEDATNPLAAYPAGTPDSQKTLKRKKLFDFDTARIKNGMFHAPNKPGSPYIYIDSAHYPFGPFATPAGPYDTVRDSSGTPFNTETFQILCAGRDEKFGTDDDMSNFWPGTRKDYLDSLK